MNPQASHVLARTYFDNRKIYVWVSPRGILILRARSLAGPVDKSRPVHDERYRSFFLSNRRFYEQNWGRIGEGADAAIPFGDGWIFVILIRHRIWYSRTSLGFGLKRLRVIDDRFRIYQILAVPLPCVDFSPPFVRLGRESKNKQGEVTIMINLLLSKKTTILLVNTHNLNKY